MLTAAELLFGPSAALRALETRYVRTAAGVARYGLPIGSPIGGGGAQAAKKAVKAAATPSTPAPRPGRHRPRTGSTTVSNVVANAAQVGAPRPSAAVQDALDVIGGTHPKHHTVAQRLRAYGGLRASGFQQLTPTQQQTVLAHLRQISTTSHGRNKDRADKLIWRFTPAGTPVGTVPPQPVLVPPTATAHSVQAAAAHGTPGLLKLAKDRGLPGDGWSRNPDGSTGPWGKYGAAGLLLSHVGADGQRRYLIVQRGPGISDPGKWQFPGGAIDSKETAHEGATRETLEELGFKPDALKDALVHGEHVHSIPGGWKYTSIAATVPTQLKPDLSTHHARAETSDAKWMTAAEIEQLDKQGKLLAPLAGGKLKTNVMSLFPATQPTGVRIHPVTPVTAHKPSKGRDLLSDKAAIDAVRQRVKQDRVRYDGKTADGRLAAIGAMQGYDDVPTVVPKTEMDRLLATGKYIEAWRGVRGAGSSALAGSGRGGGTVSKTKTAADINEDMRSGVAYYGKGIFGNGYYLAEDKKVAEQYSDGTKNSVIRVLIPKDAAVVDHADAMREAALISSPRSKAKGNSYEDGTLWDEGRYAAAKGYAGIRIPHTSRNRSYSSASHVASRTKAAWNWLDRSTLIVQEAT